MDLNGLMGFWASPEAGSIIQSIQTGEITIASGSSNGTATINAVNTTYAVCFFNGWRSAETSINTPEDYPRISLTDATTVTAQTSASNASNTRIVRYTVLEFKPFAIKSIQQGTVTISSGTSNTAAISTVNTARAFVMHLGQNHTVHHADYNYNQGRVSLTNATTVTAVKSGGSNPNLIVGFVVVEFNLFVVKSIQQITVNIAGGSATGDATISAVNDTATLLVWGGWNLSAFASNDPTRMPYVARTSTTNVRATRNASGTSTTIEVNCSVVEFESRWIKSRQAGQTQIASSASSANAAISAVNTGKSLLSWLGQICGTNTSGCNGPYTTAKINSSTQVTVERGGTPSLTATTSWEVIQFI